MQATISASSGDPMLSAAAWRMRAGLLDHVPRILEVVAGHLAGLLVCAVRIYRPALVGPLPGTVVANDDRVIALGLGIGTGQGRRPESRARAVAGALAAAGRVAVEGIDSHAG